MHAVRAVTGLAAAVAAMAAGVVLAAPAGAGPDASLNGKYLATSNGEWAKTRDSYHDEQTVQAVWTISTTCTDPTTCTGTVTSSQGWTAFINQRAGVWRVEREVVDWERCSDGTAYPGRQVYYFYAVNEIGWRQEGSTTLAGKDKTTGPSGACGVNQWLTIEMPFKLVKMD